MGINRVERLIINLDTCMPNRCSWGPCEKYSRTPYQIRVHEHLRQWSCTLVNESGGLYGRHYIYAFCSESCKDLWLACTGWEAHNTADRHHGQIYGNHSAGSRGGR